MPGVACVVGPAVQNRVGDRWQVRLEPHVVAGRYGEKPRIEAAFYGTGADPHAPGDDERQERVTVVPLPVRSQAAEVSTLPAQ